MEPITIGLLAIAAYAGYKTFVEKKPRYVGDLAKTGDEVVLSVNNLMQNNKQYDPKMAPPGTDFVTIEVQGGDADRVQGPIVAFGALRIPAKVGQFVVHRVLVDKVIRGGKVATSVSGPGSTFTGDRRLPNRFLG